MKYGLVRKLVLGISAVSIVTYGTSAFFIFVLKPLIAPGLSDWLYVGAVLALGIAWTSFLGWGAARMLIRPLVRLSEAVDEAATGNLAVLVPEYRAEDEIRRLNVSFRTMIGNLKQMIADLSANVSVTDRSAGALVSAIGEAARQIETISVTIDRVARGASAQAAAAHEMVLGASRVTASADEASRQAEQAIALSDTMVKTIADSGSTFRSLVDGMSDISATSEHTLDIVRRLDEHAKEIGHISHLVGEIAAQTHLLALNASIEAAHAGEHGHGFAVVADQIRKLASDSSAAGEQINRLVSHMQAQAGVVFRETDNQVRLVRRQKAKGEAAGRALADVTASADEAAKALRRIVVQMTAQTEQIRHTFGDARAIADIAASISDDATRVAGAAQDQTAVMQEIAASSDLLRDQADTLQRKTVAFRL
ncbi:methyl-accepting chemotaxis protein [Paenibacillus flagellatus]|nr:methyl-accepting chemotaxis protein [Paenibacillus flagellatus]